MNIVLQYIDSKPNFFQQTSLVSNVEQALRNSFSWTRKVANFPPDKAREFYYYYYSLDNAININCLDTSCGFGSRMSSVLLSGGNYFGIDANTTLCQHLNDYYNFLLNNQVISDNQKFNVINGGSEIFYKQYENMMDVCFTSPPYFNLEKYSDDDFSSTANYDNYDNWVKNFVQPTVNNIYRYLKVGGYAMINIKNINKKETCYDDFYNSFSSIEGFEFIDVLNLTIKKKQYNNGTINNNEPVMVFRKYK